VKAFAGGVPFMQRVPVGMRTTIQIRQRRTCEGHTRGVRARLTPFIYLLNIITCLYWYERTGIF